MSILVRQPFVRFLTVGLAAAAIAAPLQGQSGRLEPECPPARDSLRVDIDSGTGSNLAGEVMNRDTGRPIRDALVTLRPGDRFVQTDSLGVFRFPPVADGRYAVRIRAMGFAEYVDTLAFHRGLGTRLHVPLTPQYVDRCPTVRRAPLH